MKDTLKANIRRRLSGKQKEIATLVLSAVLSAFLMNLVLKLALTPN